MDLNVTRVTYSLKTGFVEKPETIPTDYIYCVMENLDRKECSLILTAAGRERFGGEESLQARGSADAIYGANPGFPGPINVFDREKSDWRAKAAPAP